MSTTIENIQHFTELIDSKSRVVIKFFADWCPDCKRMDLFIESVLEPFSPILFYQIDRDKFPELAERYDVMGIPSLLIFEKGKKIDHLHSANAKTPDEVTSFLGKYFVDNTVVK